MILNDNKMRYDAVNHRYVLLNDHVLEGMNIDLRDVINTSSSADVANEVDRILDRVSRIVYAYIYRTAALRYETERSFALDEKARPFLLRAMEEQLIYMLQNGDISVLSGLNVQNGMMLDRRQMKAAQIAPLAEDELIRSGYICPIIPRFRMDIVPKYEEEGY